MKFAELDYKKLNDGERIRRNAVGLPRADFRDFITVYFFNNKFLSRRKSPKGIKPKYQRSYKRRDIGRLFHLKSHSPSFWYHKVITKVTLRRFRAIAEVYDKNKFKVVSSWTA